MERFLLIVALFGFLVALLQLGRGFTAILAGKLAAKVSALPGLQVGGGWTVRGWRARASGAVLLLPIPLAIATGGGLGHLLGLSPDPGQARSDLWAGYEEYKRAKQAGKDTQEDRQAFKAKATPFVKAYGIELALFGIGLAAAVGAIVEKWGTPSRGTEPASGAGEPADEAGDAEPGAAPDRGGTTAPQG